MIAMHQRVVLERMPLKSQGAIRFLDKKGPAAAKTRHGFGRKGLLELGKTAKSRVQSGGQFTCRLRRLGWAHNLPKERVVGVTTAVIDDGLAGSFRNLVQIGQKLLNLHG